jgi:hypothetical protein
MRSTLLVDDKEIVGFELPPEIAGDFTEARFRIALGLARRDLVAVAVGGMPMQ